MCPETTSSSAYRMPARSELIAAARGWLGRPYRPGGAQTCGVNCFGLFIAILRGLNGFDDLVRAGEPYVGLSQPPNPLAFLAGLSGSVQRIHSDDAEPGDFIVYRFDGQARHLALVTAPGMVLHADNKAGRVVEHRIPPRWQPAAGFRIAGLR